MQSGITASAELKEAFNTLVSTPSHFALLATIASETLVPGAVIHGSSFPADLALIPPHLSPTAAAYVLIKTDASSPSGGYLAVTFVPDAAPVRQKMLFASTRLTLLRELGVERFGESLFATTVEECGPAGWERHVAHGRVEVPLTEEERASRGIKEAEMMESGGTRGREMGGMMGAAGRGDGVRKGMERGPGVEEEVRKMGEGEPGRLVVLRIDVAREIIELDHVLDGVGVGLVKDKISDSEPRYAFYNFEVEAGEVKPIFIYTCPSASKIKERMVYATVRLSVVKMAELELGFKVAKTLEGSSPLDFPEEVIRAEFVVRQEESKGFARPKRPGRR